MLDVEQVTRYRGNDLVGPDGDKIGQIKEIYLDDHTGDPEWALVNTGLFGMKSNFVPIRDAQPQGDNLKVPYGKDKVKDAPSVDADQHLSVDEERELYRYYDMEYEQVDTTGTTGTPGTTGTTGTTGREPVGRDTSGPTTDDAMTRTEEEVRVDKEQRPAERARLRKHVVTDHVETTVPVQREEARVVREPVTDANVDQATSGPDISEEEHEITLMEEEPRVETHAVPKERVRLDKDTVTEERQVGADVRREEIEGPDSTR